MKLTLANRKVLVIGLGKTGLSALRWLQQQGANVVMADTRTNPPGLDDLLRQGIAVHCGELTQDLLLDSDVIVLSPGVALQQPVMQMAIAQGIPVVGDVELFAQYRPSSAKLIVITGSNGKSTVTTLVGDMCQQAGLETVVAGNIGVPVLDTLLTENVPDVYVLELSSFQLETTTSLHADVATVLNISEDHMDRYDSLQDYAQAKARIYQGASLAVINQDDAICVEQINMQQVRFGLSSQSVDYGLLKQEQTYLSVHQQPLMSVADLKVAGQHNLANALAAIALAQAIGVDDQAIINALRRFKGLPHRVAWVANIDQVDYFDDSKGTNVGATCAALNGLGFGEQARKIVLIAGGDGKGQDFSPLLTAVQHNARAVVLFGQDALLIEQVLLASDVPLYRAIDLPEAVAIAQKMAQSNDAVLLSPACASLDMFDNYIHRAQVFIDAVTALQEAA